MGVATFVLPKLGSNKCFTCALSLTDSMPKLLADLRVRWDGSHILESWTQLAKPFSGDNVKLRIVVFSRSNKTFFEIIIRKLLFLFSVRKFIPFFTRCFYLAPSNGFMFKFVSVLSTSYGFFNEAYITTFFEIECG